MSYHYEDRKAFIFTDEGQRMFLEIRDYAKNLLAKAGAARCQEIISVARVGSSWDMLACVDRLVELGEIREIPQAGCYAQDRIFVRR